MGGRTPGTGSTRRKSSSGCPLVPPRAGSGIQTGSAAVHASRGSTWEQSTTRRQACLFSACVATVRGTYGTAKAGTRTQYLQYTWGPGGERPCASGTFTTREAGTHGLYVPYGGPRLYLSTQFSASPHTSRPAMRASSEAESTGSACGRAPCAGMTIEQHDEAHATHEACSVPSTVESR